MKTEVLNVRISKEIVKWLDSLIAKGIYNSRAEAVRDFAREYLSQKEANKNE